MFGLEGEFAGPVKDEDDAADHATKMGEVGDVTHGTGDAEDQLQYPEADDEGPGGHGQEEVEIDFFVRIEHAEGEQHAEDCTRGADGRIEAAGKQRHDKVSEGCGNRADEVIEEETVTPEGGLDDAAEHPQHEHVDENVPHAAVQECIGDVLPDVKTD